MANSEQKTMPAGTVVKRGAAGTALAAALNAAIAWIAARILSIPAVFEPLELPRVVLLTVLGGALATAAFAIVQRFADDAHRTFVKVALVALVLSFVPDVALLANPSAMPGTTMRGVIVLMLMHVVAALAIVPVLIGGWPPEDG